MALAALFLISYSCSPETDLDTTDNLENINASAKKAGEEEGKKRPWKIRGSGTFAPDFSISECGLLLPLKIEGSGIASHIGRYDVVITWCTGGPGSPLDFLRGTITAANGDEIDFYSVNIEPFVIDYEVDGGTGRFADAKGEFTLTQTEFVNETPEGPFPSGAYANEGGGYIIY